MKLARQQTQRPSKRSTQGLTSQEIRHDGQGQLVEVADEFGRVGEVGGLVGSASDVAEVGAGEGVCGARIAAHGDGFRDDGGDLQEVGREIGGTVFVDEAERAAVPGRFGSAVAFWRLAHGIVTSCPGFAPSQESKSRCHQMLR